MAFLIGILSAIAAGIFFLYRMKQAGDQGREMYDDVKGAIRRGQWSKQAEGRLIEKISDPREAAAILMVQLASYDGEVTAAQKTRMKNLMTVNFQADEDEAEGLYSFGRMAIGQINDAANSLSHLMVPIKETLTLTEMRDLVQMLETVAEIEGAPNERQRHLIAAVRRALSLDTAM